MSRNLMDEDYYVSHGGKIPVKWTAPEVLRKYQMNRDLNSQNDTSLPGHPLQEVLHCQ